MRIVTREQRFKTAVVGLHMLGIYPGPTALNAIIHAMRSRNLDGRESQWRIEAMEANGILFKRPKGRMAAKKQMTGQPQ